MSQTFVNFSQVKTRNCNHSLRLLVLREFILTLFGRNYQFFNPKFFTGCRTNEWQCQNLRICVSIIVLENLRLVLEKSLNLTCPCLYEPWKGSAILHANKFVFVTVVFLHEFTWRHHYEHAVSSCGSKRKPNFLTCTGTMNSIIAYCCPVRIWAVPWESTQCLLDTFCGI